MTQIQIDTTLGQDFELVNDNEMNVLAKKGMHWSFSYETEEFVPPYPLVTEWHLAEVS